MGSNVKANLTVDVDGKRVIDVSHPKNNPLISNLQSRGRAQCKGYYEKCKGKGKGNCCSGLKCTLHNPLRYCTNQAFKRPKKLRSFSMENDPMRFSMKDDPMR